MRWLVLAFTLASLATGVAAEDSPVSAAELAEPTDRYDHAVLGDALEWGALRLTLVDGRTLIIRLPETRVYEDIEARLADLDNDGRPEVIVVETDLAMGASLAIYGPKGKIAATPFIGRTHRWLAPAGIADFDGDGQVEVAYVDRPHLLADLVFVALKGDRLVELARLPGLTNHRIGEDFISGGVRDCGAGPELVLASKDWSCLIRVRGHQARDIGPMPATGINPPPPC